MPELPQGTVTLVFTDVEGSTRLWEESPDEMLKALAVLDQLVDEAVGSNDGLTVKPRGEGDSHFLVFESAGDAVMAMADLQRQIAATNWPTARPIKVRASLHTGSPELTDGDYYGSVVNRAARLRAVAHGGQTVLSGATWELVTESLPEDVTLQDMGEHRLKDLTRPERVFQLSVDGLDNTFPPLRSLDAIPNNLPEQLTEFIGRERELAESKSLLGDTRLLTILAPGGTGKTRLAIQAAADLSNEFSDGTFFIGLAEIESSKDIIQVVAESLGLGLSSADDIEVQLLNYLSTKNQLLVFDNFEHVTDGAGLVSAILKRATAVKVIVTSRAKLNLSGETVMAISGLDTSWDSTEDAFQTESVRLFVDAASRASPSFELTEDDLPALGKILGLVDGLPLAIVLAASWVDMLGVAQISDEIENSLDFLETELGDVPDRHRSVRAVFDYSWSLLDESQQDIFSKLSVFRGGFTREAAETVAGASLRSLAQLAGKSLITPNVTDGRFSIHELLRQFAETELEERQEFEAILKAHTAYYTELVSEAMSLLSSADQVRMAATIEADLENIRGAWRRSIRDNEPTNALHLLRGLYHIYEWRGWYPSAVNLFGEAVSPSSGAPTDQGQLQAMAQMARGWFLSLTGQTEDGLQDATEGKAALPRDADPVDHWIARQCVALCYGYTGSIQAAIDIADEGIAITSEMADGFYLAGMKNWRSFAAVLAGDLDTAARLTGEAMQLFEERDEHYFMTWALWIQGLVAVAEGRAADAIDLTTRQVERSGNLGYQRGRVVGLEALGDANLAAGKMGDAEEAYLRSMKTADQMGMVTDMVGLMAKIANVWIAQNREAEAVELLAAVCAEPLSKKMTFSYTSPIRESAAATLKEIEGGLDADEFAAAKARGQSRHWETLAKDLMTRLED